MQGAYWRRVHQAALSETCTDLGLETWRKFTIKAFITAALIVLLAAWGQNDLSQDEVILKFALSFIILLIFPVVYIFHIVATPAKLARKDTEDAEKKIQALSQNSPMSNVVLRSLANTQERADELGQRLMFLATIFRQYQRLLDASFSFARYRGVDLQEYDIDIIADFLSTELKPLLPALPIAPQEPIIFVTGWNRYRYILDVPMRIAPQIEFPNLPEGVSAKLIRSSKIDFEVEFFDATSLNRKRIDPQPFTASAEL